MSMPTQQPSQRPTRTVSIRVLDINGQPAIGAVVRIAVNGVRAGSSSIGSSGAPHSIELGDARAKVEVIVLFNGTMQTRTLTSSTVGEQFNFHSVSPIFAGPVPSKVGCADGTTGYP